jgi:rhamnose transport system ATP-binding protein
MSSPPPTLRLVSVSKVYPGVRALDGVSLDFARAQVHGVVGENGAGKSTLIQLIAGGIVPDEGRLELDGESTPYTNPAAARGSGISVVFQEFQSLPGVTVTENLLLGSKWGSRGFIRWRAAHRTAEQVLKEVGLELDVRAPMETLSPAQRKLVEIARAVNERARVVLLDEPTAALEADDSERVLAAMRRLREAGCAVVFVSHRLKEVLDVCDPVSVLRDGRHVGTYPVDELSPGRLAHLMVGRDLDALTPAHATPRSRPLLQVRGLSAGPRVRGLDLTVHEGEVVGLAGVLGSGRSEVGRALFGLMPLDAGTVALEGEQLRLRSPIDALRAGVAYVPSDRQRDGMIFTFDIERNLSLSVLRRLQRRRMVDRARERSLADELFARLRVVATGLSQEPETLSGGNQQKVLLGRWLAADPRILILDEPTQGIDIGAKAEIHGLIADLASRGLGVLLISSDLPELLGMSDRIEVLHQGEAVASFPRGTADETRVMLAASGEPQTATA